MATYEELLREDVYIHEPCENPASWPSHVSQFVQSLKNELKLPGWLKSGPVPYINYRAVNLLDRLRASNDASVVDLWDNAEVIDKESQDRVQAVVGPALVDCARVRSVVETEFLTDTPYPKESFLVILVREAFLNAHTGLSALEEIPVVFPRHFSGEAIQIINYMTKKIYVPLIISVYQDMPVEKSEPDPEQPADEEEASTVGSKLFKHSPPTLSEWLRTPTPEEVEEEEEEPEDDVVPPKFEVHFFACSPSTTPPSGCHIPVLCMAEEEQLSVAMSSLLYQRRVWHLNDPLIGLEFTKYGTVIRLFVGWLDDDLPSDRVLPRVHLLEVETPIELDLSSPSVTIILSRLFLSLEPYLSGIRQAAGNVVDQVFSETQDCSPLSWRIDTDARGKKTSAFECQDVKEKIQKWAESQVSVSSE